MIRRAFLAVPLLALACSTPSANLQAEVRKPERAAGKTAMVVKVDHREELFGIIFRIAGADEYRRAPDTRYVRAVDSHFSSFREHAVIKATQAIRKSNGIGFDAPQSLLIYLDDGFFPRRPLSPLPPGLDPRWKGVALDDYLAQVRDFAKVTHASAFFASNADYYRAVETRFREPIEKEDAVPWFDAFFGERSRASYFVVPGLLNGGGNYGTHAVLEDGREELYQVVALEDLDADELPRPSDRTIQLLVHELAHSYVNPLLDANYEKFRAALEPIYRWVEKPMRKQAYGNAQTLGNESLVRAITVLYVRDRRGPAQGDRAAQEETRRSFYWVGDLSKLLEQYRSDRGTYESFQAFLPQMVSFYEKLSQTYAVNGLPKLPFAGPINAALTGALVFVTPQMSGETKPLNEYIGLVKRKFAPKAQSIDCMGKTWAGLSQGHVVLYGTPESNPLLKDLFSRHGLSVAHDGVSVGDKRIEGANLVLIASRAHPNDPYRGVVAYAASRDADLVGVNGVFHGPTDWLVARRLADGKFETVAQGNFEPGPAP